MKIENFFEAFMKEEYPKGGKIRRWWEKLKMKVWLKLPTGREKETNGDFIRNILD